MSLMYFSDSPYDTFKTIMVELESMNSKMYPELFETLSIAQIDNMLDDLRSKETFLIREAHPYGSWAGNAKFIQIKMLQEGLGKLREYREELEISESLIPEYRYYRNVKQFGSRIEGQMCLWLGESRPANWVNFVDVAPIMKVLEVLRHGNEDDFRKIYVEMANGRPDGLSHITMSHITESSDDALDIMEAYCDERWDGPWAWEVNAPYKLNRLIEEKIAMRDRTIYEIYESFKQLLREVEEGAAEKFEIISYSRNLSDEIQSLIDRFSKIAGETIVGFKSMVLSSLGDSAAVSVEQSINAPLNQVADSLSRLKMNIDKLVIELENHEPDELDGMRDNGMNGAGMEMGGQPMDGMPPDMNGEQDPNMPPPEMGEEPDMGAGMPPMPPTATPPERPKKRG